MPSNIFLSMAVGLIGLNTVVAGPCKPLASTYSLTSSATEIFSSSTVESIGTEASTSTESLVSETVTSTVIAATTTDFSSSLSATATSADTTTLFTTETSADTTVLATTLTLSETTTAETTTATAEPTGFFIVAGPGAALGKKLETSEFTGAPIMFNANRGDAFQPRRFVLDDSTGRLQRNGMSLCASFGYYEKNVAKVTLCDPESYYYGTSYLTCGQSATPGSTLQCSAVRLDCVPRGPSGQACTEVTEPGSDWNGKFYIDTADDGESYLAVGVDNLGGRYAPVDIFVDFVVVEN